MTEWVVDVRLDNFILLMRDYWWVRIDIWEVGSAPQRPFMCHTFAFGGTSAIQISRLDPHWQLFWTSKIEYVHHGFTSFGHQNHPDLVKLVTRIKNSDWAVRASTKGHKRNDADYLLRCNSMPNIQVRQLLNPTCKTRLSRPHLSVLVLELFHSGWTRQCGSSSCGSLWEWFDVATVARWNHIYGLKSAQQIYSSTHALGGNRSSTSHSNVQLLQQPL